MINFVFVKWDQTRGNSFKLREGQFRLDVRNNLFYCEGDETLEQIAKRGVDAPLSP